MAKRNLKRVSVIDSDDVLNDSKALMSNAGTKDSARKALINIGDSIGLAISRMLPADAINPLSIVVTTKSDSSTFGYGITKNLTPAKQGFMDFGGKRGIDALSAPIRDLSLPQVVNQSVRCLVIAKSVLATGCTAISLTRTALAEYNPELLVISTIFYSVIGLNDLEKEFPNARFIVVGKPLPLQQNGMLDPIINLPDEPILV